MPKPTLNEREDEHFCLIVAMNLLDSASGRYPDIYTNGPAEYAKDMDELVRRLAGTASHRFAFELRGVVNREIARWSRPEHSVPMGPIEEEPEQIELSRSRYSTQQHPSNGETYASFPVEFLSNEEIAEAAVSNAIEDLAREDL